MAVIRRLAIWFGIWSAVGLFFFSQDVSLNLYFKTSTPWWPIFASRMGGAWLTGLLAPAVLWAGARFPIERPHRLAHTILHVAFCAVFAVVLTGVLGVFAIVTGFLGPLTPSSLEEGAFVVGLHGSVARYWGIYVVQHAIRYARQKAALEGELARAQLDALKMQMQPHFLFNTLNAIMVLVRQQRAQEAEQTLAHLSDLLRAVIEVDAQEVPLHRELEYVRMYLAIERIRFGDRLHVELGPDPDTLDAAVPHLAFQPIVENAVRYGVGNTTEPVAIRIHASMRNTKYRSTSWRGSFSEGFRPCSMRAVRRQESKRP